MTMNVTPARLSADEMQLELLRALSPEERLARAAALRQLNLELLAAGIREREGHLPPGRLRLELLRCTLPERLFRAAYGAP